MKYKSSFPILLLCLPSLIAAETLYFGFELTSDAVGSVSLPNGASPTGEAVVVYDTESRTLEYHIEWEGLTGELVAMHFHGPAPAGSNAGVQVGIDDLELPSTGSAVISEEQESQLLEGLWYLNLHTSENPGGELRGQVSPGEGPLQEWTFALSHAQQPDLPDLGDANPQGTGWISYDSETNVLKYVIHTSGLTGPAVAAHFHGPAGYGTNAGVALGINDLDDPMMGLAVLDAKQEFDLLTGSWYVNVHTAGNGGGEIRGQVVDAGVYDVFSFSLSSMQSLPAPDLGDAQPSGHMLAVFNRRSLELDWWLTYDGLTGSASAAHFHGPAPIGKTAGVQIGLDEIESGSTGSAVLTPEQAGQLMSGLWYLNVHTEANGLGEIRGQVVADFDARVYVNDITPGQAVNQVDLGDAEPYGNSIVVYEPETRMARWLIQWAGLTGEAVNAHFHGPALSGSQSGVAWGIDYLSSPSVGERLLTTEEARNLQAGLYYVNVHTAMNGPGEIRGQVLSTPWDYATPLGAGWMSSPWFGLFFAGNLPWVYHSDNGWMYSTSDRAESAYLYVPDTGWIWTASFVYPDYYVLQSGIWRSL